MVKGLSMSIVRNNRAMKGLSIPIFRSNSFGERSIVPNNTFDPVSYTHLTLPTTPYV